MNIKKLFTKGGFLSQLVDFGIGPILGIFISLVTVPITTRLLAPEEFGKTSMFSLMISLFDLIVLLGFDQAYVRFYNDKTLSRKKLLDNSLFVPFVFCIVLLPCLFLFRKAFSVYLFESYEPVIITYVILYLPVVLLNRFAMLSIRMELKGKLYSFLNILQQIINFIVLLSLLFFFEKSYKAIVIATILSTFLTSALAVVLSKQFFPLHKPEIDRTLIKELFIFAIPLVPTSILSWMMSALDKMALRKWTGFEELGLYTAALKIVNLANVMNSIFSTTWTPMAYKWFENNEPKEKYENAGTLVMSCMTVFLSLIVVCRKLIIWYLGAAYASSVNILVFLMFIPAMSMVTAVTGQGIGFSKKTVFNIYIWGIASAVNLLGNFILVPRYGATGAALATCFSYIIFFVVATLFSQRVWIKFKLTNYFINIAFLLALGINLLVFNSIVLEYVLFAVILVFNVMIIIRVLKKLEIF